MHKPGHRQKYSNRPSVSNIVEKRRLEEKNKVDYIKNLMFRGNKASMQEFINKASVEYKPWYAEDKLGNYFLNKANLDKKPINEVMRQKVLNEISSIVLREDFYGFINSGNNMLRSLEERGYDMREAKKYLGYLVKHNIM